MDIEASLFSLTMELANQLASCITLLISSLALHRFAGEIFPRFPIVGDATAIAMFVSAFGLSLWAGCIWIKSALAKRLAFVVGVPVLMGILLSMVASGRMASGNPILIEVGAHPFASSATQAISRGS